MWQIQAWRSLLLACDGALGLCSTYLLLVRYTHRHSSLVHVPHPPTHTHFFAFLALVGPLIFPPYNDPSRTIQQSTMALYSGHCHVPCSHAGRHTQANVPKATWSRSQAGGHTCASKQASTCLEDHQHLSFSNKYPWARNWKLTLQGLILLYTASHV